MHNMHHSTWNEVEGKRKEKESGNQIRLLNFLFFSFLSLFIFGHLQMHTSYDVPKSKSYNIIHFGVSD